MDINECLKEGYLTKEKPAEDLIGKEIAESRYDFEKALEAFDNEDYKWAIIKSYYSMFHSAKAACFKLGYREKRHFVLIVILKELNKQGKLEISYVNDFEAAISARESANYRYSYSKVRAEKILKMAEEFNNKLRDVLNKI